MKELSRDDLLMMTEVEAKQVWGGSGGGLMDAVGAFIGDVVPSAIQHLVGSSTIGPEDPQRTPQIVNSQPAENTLIDHFHTA